MTVRITFRSEIYFEGDSMEDIKNQWLKTQLFSEQAEMADAEFVEVVSVEDAENYDDLMSDFNNAY